MSSNSSSTPSVAANRGSRVLRIGVVKAGRVVEERVIRTRTLVAVGSSERNEIVLGTGGAPARFELFQLEGGNYVLNFTPEMDGRVVLPGGKGSLADLRRSNLARDAGGYHQVKLDDDSRGRVVIGDASLIFEFVEPPLPVIRPTLPSMVMGGSAVDWTFTAFVTGSFVFFFGFGLYLSQLDPIIEAGLRALPDDLAHLVIDEPPPPEVDQDTPQTPSDTPTETAQNEPERNSAPSNDASRDVTSSAEAQATLAHDVTNQVMNEIMGSLGSDAVGDTVRNMFQGGSVSEGLGEMLQTATGSSESTGAGGRIREQSGSGGSGTTGSLGALNTGNTVSHSASSAPTPEVNVRRGTVRASGGTEIGGSGTFDSSAVGSRLRSIQTSLQRCYENALTTTPNLEGRVSAQFTITESGGVTSVEVDAPNAALGSCVSSVLARLRFNPAPVGGSVRYSTAFAFAAN